MAFDLKAWLDEVGIDPKQPLDEQLKDQTKLTKLQSSVMRTSDYKKSKDDVAKLQREIEDKDRLLDADYAKLGEARAEMDKTFQRVKRERDALAAQANGIIAKVKTAFESNGLDPEELGITEIADFEPGGDDDAAGVGKGGKRAPTVDTSNLLTKEEFNEKLTLIVRGMRGTMDAGAELLQLDQEHRSLFNGKPLPNAKTVMKEYVEASTKAAKAGKTEPTLTEFVEERFGFAARREEIGAVPVHMTKAELEEYTKRKQEEAVIAARNAEVGKSGDGAGKPGGSKILGMRETLGKPREEVNRAAHERRGVDKAIANYETYEAEVLAKS